MARATAGAMKRPIPHPDCGCRYEWKSLGILYGISMGTGWVRVTTEPTCTEHGERRGDEATLDSPV